MIKNENYMTNKKIAAEATNNKKITNKMTNSNTSNNKIIDSETSNKKISNKKVSNKKSIDSKTSNKKISNKKISNKKVTNKKATNKKIIDSKTSNKKTIDSKTSNKKTIDNKTSNKKTIKNNTNKINNKKTIKWSIIIHELDDSFNANIPNAIKNIAKKYKKKIPTVKKKYKKWISNNKQDLCLEDSRGKKNQIFTDDEEKELFEYIKNTYIDSNMYIDDNCLAHIAKKKWNDIHNDDTFKASKGWVYYYKKKWNLSSFKARCSKKATIKDSDILEKYIERCKSIYVDIDKSFIFNMDETFWRIFNRNLTVIGIKGSENRIYGGFYSFS
jgi:hypothetical protein